MSPQPKRKSEDEEPKTAEETTSTTDDAASPDEKKDADAVTFSVEQLRVDGAAITGHPLHAVIGAFYGAPDGRQVTPEDAKARVEEWLQAPEAQPEPANDPAV